jgi:aspartyl-tRNA(Asn)/glutamyl-tRNA(Gln) amidotransferase subunit A
VSTGRIDVKEVLTFAPQQVAVPKAGAAELDKIAERLKSNLQVKRVRIEGHADKGEGKRAFIRVYRQQAIAAADASDAMRKAGLVPGPLAGIPVSIKNLCNIAGETTLAGSKALDDTPPATADAPALNFLENFCINLIPDGVRSSRGEDY